jgi:NADPH:quinone reductase-like Zn-dependent oxidoreductase
VPEELGFDACIDHRAPDFTARLAAACPKGIDVYFENVGGAVFEAVFPLLNPFARIPVCGLISMYNAASLSPGPILLPHLMRAILTKRLTFRGFIVSTTIRPTPTWWSLVTAFSLIYREFPANYVIRTTSPLALNKDRLFARDGEYINSKWSVSM